MNKTELFGSKQELDNFPDLREYLKGIPSELHDLFVGNSESEFEELSESIKRQRRDQQERKYVIAIQQRYRLPLRPNSTVKATMIQARLRLQRLFLSSTNGKHYRGIDGELPVDPFE